MAEKTFDLIVIGGGSGGMACAKAAADMGARVVIFDYVTPSSRGTKWGLGGTCVNVGCVPKKLMHYAATMQQILSWDSLQMGWGDFAATDPETMEPIQQHVKCNWEALVERVQLYIKQLNFGYRNGLRAAGCTYINALARLTGSHTVEYQIDKNTEVVRGEHIIIAVGGRPYIPKEVKGAKEYAITSDDLFSLKNSPQKTLVVGAGYVALECAGILQELGCEVTVAVRSVVLRGFDRQCANKIGQYMKEIGISFLESVVVEEIERSRGYGRLQVTMSKTSEGNLRVVEYFDTVLYATGRVADTAKLNLESVGVKCTDKGRICCGPDFRTSVGNIYAIGDAVDGFPELTPVAIKAGENVARRLFSGVDTVIEMEKIPTTVFTPMEYGCVGLSEDDAIEKFGAEDVEVFLYEFSPLELSATHRQKAPATRKGYLDITQTPPCLAKLICTRHDALLVRGIHFVGPHAGELIQGMAIAIKLGATKSDFDDTVGIHPTNAEAFVQLSITRRSGKSWLATGGCGGGKCG